MLRAPLLVLTALAAFAPQGEVREAELGSLFVMPLTLGVEPPPLRSVRNIHLVHTGLEGVSRNVTRTPAEAAELARSVARELREGADFEDLARRYSADRNARHGAVLGTFPPGVLGDRFDAFLQAAEVGEISAPIEDDRGFHVLQRVETYAAIRQIVVEGTGDEEHAEATALFRRLREGADFAELARAGSGGAESAERKTHAIFERGPSDALVKAAAFRMRVGDVAGPISTPLGFHVLERLPLDAVDPSLRENNFVRVRAILIAHDQAPPGSVRGPRSPQDAHALAQELHARILAGEDMAAIARELNDDPDGRERAGDLGWVHRRNPNLAPFLAPVFRAEPGELLDVIVLSSVGFVVVRRES